MRDASYVTTFSRERTRERTRDYVRSFVETGLIFDLIHHGDAVANGRCQRTRGDDDGILRPEREKTVRNQGTEILGGCATDAGDERG